jgi:hypothetical protein
VPELLATEVAKLHAALVEFEDAEEGIDAAIVDGLASGDEREIGSGVWLSDSAVKPAAGGPQTLVSSSAGP